MGLPWLIASIARDMYPLPATIPVVNDFRAPMERYMPPKAQDTPQMARAANWCFNTLSPAALAAAGFSPTALILMPSFVL